MSNGYNYQNADNDGHNYGNRHNNNYSNYVAQVQESRHKGDQRGFNYGGRKDEKLGLRDILSEAISNRPEEAQTRNANGNRRRRPTILGGLVESLVLCNRKNENSYIGESQYGVNYCENCRSNYNYSRYSDRYQDYSPPNYRSSNDNYNNDGYIDNGYKTFKGKKPGIIRSLLSAGMDYLDEGKQVSSGRRSKNGNNQDYNKCIYENGRTHDTGSQKSGTYANFEGEKD